MKYRTKLYISLVGVTVAGTLLSIGIIYFETRDFLFRELRNKAVSISSTAAVMLDGDLLKKIYESGDETTQDYLTFQQHLRNIRNVNRGASTYVKYIYTIKPDPKNPLFMVYGVDAEEDPQNVSHLGEKDVADPKIGLLDHLYEGYSPPEFITDQYGVWETGFFPIFDSEGHYVATLGVDVPASYIMTKLNTILEYGAIGLAASLLLAAIIAHFLSYRVTTSLSKLCERTKKIGEGDLVTETHFASSDEFSTLAEAINTMTRGLQERERLKMNFARYVSHHVMERILEAKAPLKLEGERRKVTVLFSDIRQFTFLSEKLDPEMVVSYLNEYFEKMLEVIFKNHGTLDKFIGDGIMVEFGAPLEDAFQEKNAVNTALEMQEAVAKLCEKWKKENKPTIEIGIGIHTGHAVIGNIGTEQRMEYTAIGDTVNVASRLEKATKLFKSPILISETTYKGINVPLNVINLGPVALPGRTQEIVAYAVLPHKK